MKVISPRIHGYFDFLTVVIFLLAPALLGLSQLPAMLAYSLAAVHLIVTLTSDFPFGIFRLIPFAIHGWIERLVDLPSLLYPLSLALPMKISREIFISPWVLLSSYLACLLIIKVRQEKAPQARRAALRRSSAV